MIFRYTEAVIDSRKAIPGSIFFALKGEKADGHDFISDAFNKWRIGRVIKRNQFWIIPFKCLIYGQQKNLKGRKFLPLHSAFGKRQHSRIAGYRQVLPDNTRHLKLQESQEALGNLLRKK